MGSGFCDEEHASVVIEDICRRPRTNAQTIVFANEKGGVGKSTLAFHVSITLARAGHDVLAIDLDRRQRSLGRALEHREATARSLGIHLPSPQHLVLEHHSSAMLAQEIARVGSGCTKIVIDVAGHDSPIARRAIAMADKLVTPVNATFVDLDSLAQFNPASMRFSGMGSFAELVTTLRGGRIERGLPDMDWALVKNRVRHCEKKQLMRFDAALQQLPVALGVRLAAGLTERVAYRDLFLFGLTHADCRDLPGIGKMRMESTQDIEDLIDELGLRSEAPGELCAAPLPDKSPVRSMKRYRQSLRRHIGARRLETTYN